jgi:hypothetical protein
MSSTPVIEWCFDFRNFRGHSKERDTAGEFQEELVRNPFEPKPVGTSLQSPDTADSTVRGPNATWPR